MAKINENELAKEISCNEGQKQEISIGQIKEILRITLELLSRNYLPSEVLALLEKHGE